MCNICICLIVVIRISVVEECVGCIVLRTTPIVGICNQALMLLSIGMVYNFTRTNGVWLPFFNKTLLALYHHSSKSSGIYRLALRQPVNCLPMLSIKFDSSVCFFIAKIFISTKANFKFQQLIFIYLCLLIYSCHLLYCLYKCSSQAVWHHASCLAPRCIYTREETPAYIKILSEQGCKHS